MSFTTLRKKNSRSLTSFTIGKPFLVPFNQNLSQDELPTRKKTNELPDHTKTYSNHEKCSILVKHLEETIKEKSLKIQNLLKEKHHISLKFEQTSKILAKERENFEGYVKSTQREECLPNSHWKGKYSEMKSRLNSKIETLTEEISILEKRLKDFDRFNSNSKKKIESLSRELEAKDRHISIILNEKSEILEKLDLCSILSCRLLHLLKILFSGSPAVSLNLEYMNLENSFIPVLSKILEMNPQIEMVDLEGNFFNDEGLKEFSGFLANSAGNLHTLNFSLNKITSRGAWEVLNSAILRENSNGKNFKKIVFSYNALDENEVFIRAFEETKNLRKNYPIVKLKKKDFALARGPQLNKLFHLLCDKMFDCKLVKQLTVLLDRTEILHKTQKELEKMMIKNKKEVFLKFSNDLNTLEKENDLKAKLVRLSTKKLKNRIEDCEIDITMIMAQRPTFALSYIKKLIKEGLKINAVDSKLDESLLMFAARTGNLNLTRLLVSKNPGIDVRNVRIKQSKGLNAFLVACNYDNFEIADLLMLSGGRLDSVDNKGANAIHYAVRDGKSRRVARLVEMGLSINWTDYKKRTPLHYAAKHGDFLMAELLIKLGGDANPLDYKGRSPAALAEDKGKNYFSKTLASLGGKKIRMVVGKEELKQSREAKNERSLEGLARSVCETVENTKKLFRDLEKTNQMLDSSKLFLNKSLC